MMTSVVACGNGYLSDGKYRGLASEANVVLVKCGQVRRVAHDDIRRGLDWVYRHRREYGIRIVNVSVGGDYEAPYQHDALSRSAERLVRAGVFVCAAVGNAGHLPGHPVMPPASAPSVLAVGGLDDKNQLAFEGYDLYHSSYGPTVDGLQKPEVIAPSIWVAAPILPGTPTAAQAQLLHLLEHAPVLGTAGHPREPPGRGPGAGRRTAPRAAAHPPAGRGAAARRQRDFRPLQARGRHQLRVADRRVRGGPDAGSESGAHAARDSLDPDPHRPAAAARRRWTSRAGAWCRRPSAVEEARQWKPVVSH